MKAIPLLLLLSTTSAFAGTTIVKGISNIGKSPDYLELRINSVSKCFKTAKESNVAVATLSDQIKNLVMSHIDWSNGDQLTVSAGQSARRRETETVFNHRTNRNETNLLCEQGWTSSRQIVAKVANLHMFEQLNPQLLDLIDQAELDQRTNNNGVLTATVGEPMARLMPETIASMEEQALKESLINASNKFQVIKSVCNLVNTSIAGIEEARSVVRDYRDNTDVGSAPDSLSFADKYVHLAYNITFSFDNTGGVCAENSDLL